MDTLTTDKNERKQAPIARGCLDYFPLALAEVARLSYVANQQHNPGEEMHWAREKSTDHADCILRHMVDRGKVDTDGMRHSAKVAWRALAQLQLELEGANKPLFARPSVKVRTFRNRILGSTARWRIRDGVVYVSSSPEVTSTISGYSIDDFSRLIDEGRFVEVPT